MTDKALVSASKQDEPPEISQGPIYEGEKKDLETLLAQVEWKKLKQELDGNGDELITKDPSDNDEDKNLINTDDEKKLQNDWLTASKKQLSNLKENHQLDIQSAIDKLSDFITAETNTDEQELLFSRLKEVKEEIEMMIAEELKMTKESVALLGNKNARELALISVLEEGDFLSTGNTKTYPETLKHIREKYENEAENKGYTTDTNTSLAGYKFESALENARIRLGEKNAEIQDKEIQIQIKDQKVVMSTLIKGEEEGEGKEISIHVFDNTNVDVEETSDQNTLDRQEGQEDIPSWVDKKMAEKFKTINSNNNAFENKVNGGFMGKILSWLFGKDFLMGVMKTDSSMGSIFRFITGVDAPNESESVNPISAKKQKELLGKSGIKSIIDEFESRKQSSDIDAKMKNKGLNMVAKNIAGPVLQTFPDTQIMDFSHDAVGKKEEKFENTLRLRTSSENDFTKIFAFLAPAETNIQNQVKNIGHKLENIPSNTIGDFAGGAAETGKEMITKATGILDGLGFDNAGGLIDFFAPAGKGSIKGYSEFNPLKESLGLANLGLNLSVGLNGDIIIRWGEEKQSEEKGEI